MISERQLLANRLNARKSTGPRTEEGKTKSRGNALKHGLAGAGVSLSAEDCWAYTQRLKGWEADMQPEGEVERWLVATATFASVRVDRCRRAESAELSRVRRERIQDWEDEQEERLNAVLPEKTSELGSYRCDLEQFSTGCEWLATQWKILRRNLKEQGFLHPEELADMLCLLGLEEANACVADTREYELAQMNNCACSETAGAPEARQGLGALLDEQIKSLDDLAAARWGMAEARWLNEELDSAAFDASPRGALLRRYETACRNDVYRSLAQLARIRKEGVLRPQKRVAIYRTASQPAQPASAAAEPAAAPTPEAGLRNEPISAASGNGSHFVSKTSVQSPGSQKAARDARRAQAARALDALLSPPASEAIPPAAPARAGG